MSHPTFPNKFALGLRLPLEHQISRIHIHIGNFNLFCESWANSPVIVKQFIHLIEYPYQTIYALTLAIFSIFFIFVCVQFSLNASAVYKKYFNIYPFRSNQNKKTEFKISKTFELDWGIINGSNDDFGWNSKYCGKSYKTIFGPTFIPINDILLLNRVTFCLIAENFGCAFVLPDSNKMICYFVSYFSKSNNLLQNIWVAILGQFEWFLVELLIV